MAATPGDQVWAFQHSSPRPRVRLKPFHQGKVFLGTGYATASHSGHVAQSPPFPGLWETPAL